MLAEAVLLPIAGGPLAGFTLPYPRPPRTTAGRSAARICCKIATPEHWSRRRRNFRRSMTAFSCGYTFRSAQRDAHFGAASAIAAACGWAILSGISGFRWPIAPEIGTAGRRTAIFYAGPLWCRASRARPQRVARIAIIVGPEPDGSERDLL